MRSLRAVVPVTVVAALAASFLAVGQVGATPDAAADISTGAPTPTLTWQPCVGADLQCATAVVPLDYHHPHGTTISLALIRKPATDQAHRIGSLIIDPGGPGSSGVSAVKVKGDFLSQLTDGRFDIVGFDPRGLGQSTQVSCFATNDEENALFAGVSQAPVTVAEERALHEANAKLAAACAQRSPEFFAHLSSANVARDVDLLRRAVGDAQLTYAGFSYGSIIGANYAALFPDKVRALYVDGALDPRAWATGGFGQSDQPFTERVHSGLGAANAYASFLRLCKTEAARCAFSDGDPQAKSDALFARVKQAPITVGGQTFDYETLMFTVVGAMVQPAHFPDLGVLLEQLYENSSLDARGRAAWATLRAAAVHPAADVPYNSSEDVYVGVTCADTLNPYGRAAWTRGAHREERRAPNFGASAVWAGDVCATWNIVDKDRYLGPWNVRTAHPILVANTTFDPQTWYPGAQAFAREFPGARLLTVNGYGHTTTTVPSTCALQVTHDYLVSLSVPAPSGVTCGQDVDPFDPAAAASVPAGAPLGAPLTVR